VSGPVDGGVAYRRPLRADQLSVAVWVAPGRAGYVAAARRWAQSVAAAWGVAGAEVGLVVSELVTNALVHTRSGRPGGMVVVAVAGGWDSVTVHVHDLGADGCQVPWPRQAAHDAEGGRGLAIVIAVSAEWGIIPAAWCPVQRADDPAADTGGCCTWCRLVSGPTEDGKEGRDG
jgi:anti-sigma regulatory factor (Ser/Thr protein kinase)